MLTSNPDLSNVHEYQFTLTGPVGAYYSGSFPGKIVVEAGQKISVEGLSGIGGDWGGDLLQIVLTGTLIDDDGSFVSVDVSSF